MRAEPVIWGAALCVMGALSGCAQNQPQKALGEGVVGVVQEEVERSKAVQVSSAQTTHGTEAPFLVNDKIEVVTKSETLTQKERDFEQYKQAVLAQNSDVIELRVRPPIEIAFIAYPINSDFNSIWHFENVMHKTAYANGFGVSPTVLNPSLNDAIMAQFLGYLVDHNIIEIEERLSANQYHVKFIHKSFFDEFTVKDLTSIGKDIDRLISTLNVGDEVTRLKYNLSREGLVWLSVPFYQWQGDVTNTLKLLQPNEKCPDDLWLISYEVSIASVANKISTGFLGDRDAVEIKKCFKFGLNSTGHYRTQFQHDVYSLYLTRFENGHN